MRKLKHIVPMLALALMLVPAAAQAQSPAPLCAPIDLHQGADANPACDAVPHFKASFINRVWTFDGAVDEVDLDGHTLDMTTEAIENLPKRFASQDDDLLDEDTHVVFKEKTRVYDPDGELVSQDQLAYAESVAVRGKLVPPSKWAVDDNGTRIPTITAKRIYIGSYVNDASQAQDDQGQAGSDDSSAADPTPDDGAVTSADVEIWISIYIHTPVGG